METKWCSHCEFDKSTIEFSKKASEISGLQAYCKKCSGEVICISQRKLRRSLREQIFSKLGHVCKRCGFADKRALQIDHVNDDGYLVRTLWRTAQTKYLRAVLVDESGAYQILCANCNWIKRVELSERVQEVKSKQTLRI